MVPSSTFWQCRINLLCYSATPSQPCWHSVHVLPRRHCITLGRQCSHVRHSCKTLAYPFALKMRKHQQGVTHHSSHMVTAGRRGSGKQCTTAACSSHCQHQQQQCQPHFQLTHWLGA